MGKFRYKESIGLLEAGLDDEILMTAGSSFVLELIVRHGEPAKRLCNKDPFVLKTAKMVSTMLPQAKFIFMIRDGRAVVHSIITRKVGITGFNATSYRSALVGWTNLTRHMNKECESVGDRCLKVFYEQLVLHPESSMRRILEFLDLEWDSAVLRHEEFINKQGGISLSK